MTVGLALRGLWQDAARGSCRPAGTLKARKLIFTNPTRGMRTTPVRQNLPLPLDTDAIRDALSSPDPAVALVALHALTAKQVAELRLTDIADGRLSLDCRTIPLAEPVRVRLTAWLDRRARRWPNSVNPHLLIHQRTAPRLLPVKPRYPWAHHDSATSTA